MAICLAHFHHWNSPKDLEGIHFSTSMVIKKYFSVTNITKLLHKQDEHMNYDTYAQKAPKIIYHRANFCVCECFYNPPPISLPSNLNWQCPSTGLTSQFDVDLDTESRFDIRRPWPMSIVSLVNARQQFMCFSPFSSQTVLATCIPQCFLHFSSFLCVRLFTLTISHQGNFQWGHNIHVSRKSSDPWRSCRLVVHGSPAICLV